MRPSAVTVNNAPFTLPLPGRSRANMTSFTKLEVHIVSQRHERKTEPRPESTCIKNAKFLKSRLCQISSAQRKVALGVLSRRVGVNWALTENVFSATRLQNDDARDGSRYKQA